MSKQKNDTTQIRKKEHLEICLDDRAAFKEKMNGFDRYEFEHYAITEVEIEKIAFDTDFFGKNISYPFLISCMTGGTGEAENINAQLAAAARELNIPIGVGSQRQALENREFIDSYKVIREQAGNVPVLGNLGAAQLVRLKSIDSIKYLVDMIQADAFVIHINALQELIQKNGEPNFKGLLNKLGQLVKEIKIPVIVKEVGAGISRQAALKVLDCGVKGIDVAGAGGTSWAKVEIIRNKEQQDNPLSEWGLPTSYCLRQVRELKAGQKFLLIGSGGINSAMDAAKALALGADIVASARIILQQLDTQGIEGVKNLILSWFKFIKNAMFLTGAQNIAEFQNVTLIKKEDLF